MPSHSFKLIASAVARRPGELLLIQQRSPGDLRPYWGLPGGQVEPGEELLAGLERELLEETGLTLVGTPTIAFVIQILRQTEERHQQWLACHFACEVAGNLDPHDPDGLILSAHWVQEQAALEHLGTDPQYHCEPLRSFLYGEQHREPCIPSKSHKEREIVSASIILPRLDPATLAELRQRYEEAPNGESRTCSPLRCFRLLSKATKRLRLLASSCAVRIESCVCFTVS